MRRFSIRTLMVLVVVAAVGLAALRNANVYWATAIAGVVAVVVAASVIGAIGLRGREQYGWAGFAVFSVAYLGVTVGNLLPDPFKDPFRTSALLTYVSNVATHSSHSQELQRLRQALQLGSSEAKTHLERIDAAIRDDQAYVSSAARWRSWLPGALNADEFLRVGQSLLALLSGLAGSVVGNIFYARRKRSETQTP